MKNTTIFFPAILAFLLLPAFKLSAQDNLSACDTLYFRDGRVISCDIQRFNRQTVKFNLCPVDSFGPQEVKKKELESILDKDGDLFTYLINPRDSVQVSLLVLFGGKRIRGIITDRNEETITLVDLNQFYVTLKRSQIMSISTASPTEIIARLEEDNALKVHYLLMSNNFSLKKGENYYTNGSLLYSNARFGLTDNLSLGAGGFPIVFFNERSNTYWLSPKVHFPLGNAPVAIGAGGWGMSFWDKKTAEVGYAGVLYAHATVGNPFTNFTFGFGRVYEKVFDDELKRVFSLAGQIYLSPKVSFMMETHQSLQDERWIGLFTSGIRLHVRNVTTDIGAIAIANQEDIFGIPWLSFTVPFKRKQAHL